jgi:hypothetical protein
LFFCFFFFIIKQKYKKSQNHFHILFSWRSW